MNKNTEYENARNALIPLAEKYANSQAGCIPADRTEYARHVWSVKWNNAFHTKMNSLAIEAGLTQ